MRRVYRYVLYIDGPQTYQIPGRDPKVVAVSTDTVERVQVWVELEPGEPTPITLQIFGTGHFIPEGLEHRGTAVYLIKDTQLVWHVYQWPEELVRGLADVEAGRIVKRKLRSE